MDRRAYKFRIVESMIDGRQLSLLAARIFQHLVEVRMLQRVKLEDAFEKLSSHNYKNASKKRKRGTFQRSSVFFLFLGGNDLVFFF